MKFAMIRKFSIILSLLLLAGLVGYKLGINQVEVSLKNSRPTVTISSREAPKGKNVDFSLFWQVWDEVSTKYVDKTKIDQQKMIYGAISGMVASIGDPYTLFLPPTNNKESKGSLNGTFEGIGAELGMKDKQIIVVAPLDGSPALAAGIKTEDMILKVDGKETSGWSLPDAVSKIRGPKGTDVVLTVLHAKENKPVDIKITRNEIVLKSVDWKIVNATESGKMKPVMYLRLSRFGDKTDPQLDSTVAQMSDYLATSSAKVSGVVLDLRNNPGGYLTGAVYVAGEFLNDGTVVRYVDYQGQSLTYSVNRRGKLLNVPLVVLVNQGTASAGEILAGALQVRNRAKVIGMQTFGKGSVQSTQDYPNGAGLHVTIAKWLLPNDFWVNGVGLTPDYKIELDQNMPTRDLQLEKAVEVLGTNLKSLVTQ